MVLVNLHVHGACPCPCFMSMLNDHVPVNVPVHVHAAHHRYVCVCECVFVCVFVFVCIRMFVWMLDCTASDQSGTRMKKLTMSGQVRYRTKPRQYGIFLVRYRTEIIDAGMPMPALVSRMPMPSYDELHTAVKGRHYGTAHPKLGSLQLTIFHVQSAKS